MNSDSDSDGDAVPPPGGRRGPRPPRAANLTTVAEAVRAAAPRSRAEELADRRDADADARREQEDELDIEALLAQQEIDAQMAAAAEAGRLAATLAASALVTPGIWDDVDDDYCTTERELVLPPPGAAPTASGRADAPFGGGIAARVVARASQRALAEAERRVASVVAPGAAGPSNAAPPPSAAAPAAAPPPSLAPRPPPAAAAIVDVRAPERRRAVNVEYAALREDEQREEVPEVSIEELFEEEAQAGAAAAEGAAGAAAEADRLLEIASAVEDGSMLPLGLIVGKSADDVRGDPYERMGIHALGSDELAPAGGDAAQELWQLWIVHIHQKRQADGLRFLRNIAFQEDLLYGPSDGDGRRQDSLGFRRQGPDREIVWQTSAAQLGGGASEFRDGASAVQVLAQVKRAAEDGTLFRFRPARQARDGAFKRAAVRGAPAPLRTAKRSRREPAAAAGPPAQGAHAAGLAEAGAADGSRQSRAGQRGVYAGGGEYAARDELGQRVVARDPQTGLYGALMLPRSYGFRYARRATDGARILIDGQPATMLIDRPVRKATGVLRLQVVSIRLNESHWEWGYSRWLENGAMFDTPSMAPYLANDEFDTQKDGKTLVRGRDGDRGPMWTRPTAIPLLTRGSMNAACVSLQNFNGQGGGRGVQQDSEARPTLLVRTLDDIGRMTLAQVEALPRLRMEPALLAKVEAARLEDEQAGAAAQKYVVKTTSDEQRVECFGLVEGGRPGWQTLFATPEGAGGRAFFCNVYASQAAPLYMNNKRAWLTHGGYDSWAGHGEVLTSTGTADADVDARVDHLFAGHPVYVCKGTAAQPELPSASAPSTFYDVRTHVPENERGPRSGKSKFYSEVYRQEMFEPLPVTTLQTFPPASERFRAAAELPEALRKKFPAPQVPNFFNYNLTRQGDNLQQAERKLQQQLARKDDDDDGEGGRNLNAYSRFGAPADAPDGARVPLQQVYPETVMCPPSYVPERKDAALKFLKTPEGKAMKESGAFGPMDWLTPEVADSGHGKPERKKQWLAGLNSLPPNGAGLLAPTTLEDAVRRYVALHGDALAYAGKTPEGVPRWLDTSPLTGVNQPGGVYYSCRVDTGIGAGEGGLDSFFPLPNGADVYAIADVALARGVHDYLHEPASMAGGSAHKEDHRKRAGPPAWFRAETKALAARADPALPEQWPSFKQAMDLAELLERPGTKMYQQRIEEHAKVLWAGAGADARLAPRAAYDATRHPPSFAGGPPAGVDPRRKLFSTTQLRRLDTAELFQFPAQRLGPLEKAIDKALNGSGVVRPPLPAGAPPRRPGAERLPTTLRLSNGTTWSKRRIQSESNSLQTVLFCGSYPHGGGSCGAPPLVPPEELSLSAVEALPHRHDLRLPTMPLYPQRMRPATRLAVWNRLKLAYQAERDPDERPEVGPVAARAGGATLSNERRAEAAGAVGATDAPDPALEARKQNRGEDERKAKVWKKVLVAPLYVVALDYNDWERAFQLGNKAWHRFFVNDHEDYLRYKDMFVVAQLPNGGASGRFLTPNPDYVLPMRDNPARVAGTYATKDAPRLVDEDDPSSGVHEDERLAVRPVERLRTSWFQDWKRFGGRPTERGDDPQEAFKAEVVEWTRLYGEYVRDRSLWDRLGDAEAKLRVDSQRLRALSMRVCWGLGRLGAYASRATELFARDGQIATAREGRTAASGLKLLTPDLLEGGGKLWQRWLAKLSAMRKDRPPEETARALLEGNLLENNPLRIWFLRTTIPIFLIDTLDQLAELRELLAWFARAHAQLLADQTGGLDRDGVLTEVARLRRRAEAAGAGALPYVKDFLQANYHWPDVREMDKTTAAAGGAVRELLRRFMAPHDLANRQADEVADGLGLEENERETLWQRVLDTARKVTHINPARYGLSEAALEELEPLLDSLLNNFDSDPNMQQGTRVSARKLWWDGVQDKRQRQQSPLAPTSPPAPNELVKREDLNPGDASGVDLLLVLCTVVQGSRPPGFAQHPLAIALQPALRAIVDAWQHHILEWRASMIQEAYDEWSVEGQVNESVAELVKRLGALSLRTAVNTLPSDADSLAVPRDQRVGRPGVNAGAVHPDLEAVRMLFGLPAELDGRPCRVQYARELDVLAWLSDLSLRRAQEQRLFSLDNGAQYGQLADPDVVQDYTLLAVTFNAFAQIFVRLVKENKNEQVARRLTEALQNRGFGTADRSEARAMLRSARERITAAMLRNPEELSGGAGAALQEAATAAADPMLIPTSVLHAFRILEQEEALDARRRVEREQERTDSLSAQKELRRLDKFLKSLKLTNAKLKAAQVHAARLVNWLQTERQQQQQQQPADPVAQNLLAVTETELTKSMERFGAYSERAGALARFVQRVKDVPASRSRVLRALDQRHRRETAARRVRQRQAQAQAQAQAADPRPAAPGGVEGDGQDEDEEDGFAPLVAERPAEEVAADLVRQVFAGAASGRWEEVTDRFGAWQAAAPAAMGGALAHADSGRDFAAALEGVQRAGAAAAERHGGPVAAAQDAFGVATAAVAIQAATEAAMDNLLDVSTGQEDMQALLDLIDGDDGDAPQARAVGRSAAWRNLLELAKDPAQKTKLMAAGADEALEGADRAVDDALGGVRASARESARTLVASSLALRREERSVELVTGAVLALPPSDVTLDQMNRQLEDTPVEPGRLSWDRYNEMRAQDADAQAFVAAEDYGTNGWQGSYRRYVADAVQVAPADDDDDGRALRYRLDALPLSPLQWLASGLSAGPHPRPPPAPPAAPARLVGLSGGDSLSADTLEETALFAAAREIDDGPNVENTRKGLQALVDAERTASIDRTRPKRAPWAFDFDGLAPSDAAADGAAD